MKTVLMALAASTSTLALAQAPKVADLAWMAGTWVQDGADEKVSETWLGPDNGLMVGVNLTTRKNGGKTYEFLRIADTPDGPSYFASPGGRAPTEFRYSESGDGRIVFTDPTRDFPRFIRYWREGESLCARVEGATGGKERAEEWRFSRGK
jgi:uncharacterized protein DUF6265